MSDNNPPSVISRMREAIEVDLKRSIEWLDSEQYTELAHMISYHMGWKNQAHSRGKRLRPMLTLLSCAGVGANWEIALPAASAVELVHSFSLVHDDIQDQSETRRGRLTIWKLWGLAQALNTGDAIFALARLATHRLVKIGNSYETTLDVQHILDHACLQLTQGQHLDLAYETKENVTISDYIRMIEGKTSALLSAASAIGAHIAGASDSAVEAYRSFGHNLGLAFQIEDDILGIWGKSNLTGKPAGDDLLRRKKTLPTLYGLEKSTTFNHLFLQENDDVDLLKMVAALDEVGAHQHARSLAQHHTDLALSALKEAAPMNPSGGELKRLTLLLLQRQT